MAQAQNNRKAVQTAAAFRERRKPDPVVACRALWSRSTSNVGAAVEPRGNTTSSHRPLSSYKRGHQATSFIEAGAQKLAEYEELDGEERGTFLDDDDGDEVEGMDAEDRTYVKPKKKRRPPAAGAGNTWPILRKVVLADAVLREKPWVPRRVGTRKLKVEEIFALMKADICKSEPFRLLFEDISVQQMRSHFHHMMGYHLNETNKKEESARSDETQPEGEEAKLERILIDIRAEKYAYEKGKSHEKIEDQAQEDRLTKNGLQIRELAVSNCAPKDLSSPARLSDGGSGRHRSCSGGGDASGSSSGHSPLLNADGGSIKRRPGTTSRSSSRRDSPPPRLGIGAELMSQLTEECGIDDLLFKRTGASFLQYMLLIEGGWSDTQISEAMEEKLFAVLVDGVTEVMPGGEASNGYKGNNVAAKRCRSCMTWRGVGAERLGLLCARFGLETGKVKAAMLEEVPHCTDADVGAWVEGWEGDDLPWAMADKMNASFASHLVAGCRSGGLELMMDGDKNFNNEGDEQIPHCKANNREKSKSGREKGEGRYRADDASLHRCGDTLSLDSGRGGTGNGRTSSGACSVAARGLSNTDVSFAQENSPVQLMPDR